LLLIIVMSSMVLPGHVVEEDGNDIGHEAQWAHGAARIRTLEDRVMALEEKLKCISPDGCCACSDVRLVVESVKKQQCLQQESIDALQVGSAATVGDRLGRSTKSSEFSKPHPGDVEITAMEAEDDEPTVVYEFNQSMWDAAMLLPFSRISMSDKIVITIGVFLNLVMQIVFVVIVLLDMTDSPYTQDTVADMLKWRVETGHNRANIDVSTGETLLEKMCNQTLWTWEGGEYTTMSEYLNGDVPGVYLSSIAIILWVLGIMCEIRSAYEQSLALLNIPRIQREDEVGLQREEDGFRVSGMSMRAKVLCFVGLCLPRMVTAVFLGIVGCKYLAQTADLADIVLNALALAFVVEVDELMAGVLLSSKIQAILGELHPISACYNRACNKRAACCCPSVDLLRYLVTIGFIVLAIVGYLLPFHSNVRAAEHALCGGQWDFTWQTGNQTVSRIVLVNNSDWATSCNQKDYLAKHYPRLYNESHVAAEGEVLEDHDLAAIRLTSVLRNAFSSCQSGEILSQGVCAPISSGLAEALPSDVMPGGNPKSPQCSRFQPQLGTQACSPPAFHKSCTWSEYSKICEKDVDPPGYFQQQACQTERTASLQESCHVWEDVFGAQHPLKNCDITRLCRANELQCIVMTGQLVLDVSNATAFESSKSTTESAIVNALASALKVVSSTVDVLQVRGWEHNWPSTGPGRRLSTNSYNFAFEDIWNVTGSVVVNGTAMVKYAVQRLPETLLPSTIPSKTGDLSAQISANLVQDGIVVTSAEFSPWPPNFWTTEQYQAALQKMKPAQPQGDQPKKQ